ncbi:unnamed protein product [Darwinula stevensoni]|uniref:Protein kinase domain-containing protein n=1 Tax=Darwinula stevensoni TaxID=69355 RepID=A0A7R9FQ58_9CRUS|nr:unnamed protein product [Darwinula stevensoni]CAG0898833.1 unnamed protein product [Darwinula stevensoni]
MAYTKEKLGETPSELHALRVRGYRLGAELGAGAFGRVRKAFYIEEGKEAFHTQNGKEVVLAVKIIDRVRASREFAAKFLPRELQCVERLRHPFVVRTHSIVERGSKVFVFMQYCDGGDMYRFLERLTGPLPDRHAKFWFGQLISGVKYLHEELKVCHRDLKCENLLLTRGLNVKIADYGFSRDIAEDASRTFCGSPAYCAPEILMHNAYRTPIADVWSTGVILFVMVQNSLPFSGPGVKGLTLHQLTRRMEWISPVSPVCKDLIHRILQPQPEKRISLHEVRDVYIFGRSDEAFGLPRRSREAEETNGKMAG